LAKFNSDLQTIINESRIKIREWPLRWHWQHVQIVTAQFGQLPPEAPYRPCKL